MMRTRYDPEADASYARFAPDGTVIAETIEVAPGAMIGLDAAGQMVGIEVRSVRVRESGAYAGKPVLAVERKREFQLTVQ
jgi:uncharacterized protein YuzE